MITPCMQVFFETFPLQVVFIIKFTGHFERIVIHWISNAILLTRILWLSLHWRIINCASTNTIYLQCTHSGGVNLHILELVSPKPKNFNLLSMPVLSTIVQKGGDCKSKVLPLSVLDIVGQNSRGTNNVFQYKQLIRFLKYKEIGRSSRRSLSRNAKLLPEAKH